MPTGGTSELDYDDWLSVPSVIAVGGAWLAPLSDIAREDWEHIGKRARYAVSKFHSRRRQ